jgi:hypothetical protein
MLSAKCHNLVAIQVWDRAPVSSPSHHFPPRSNYSIQLLIRNHQPCLKSSNLRSRETGHSPLAHRVTIKCDSNSLRWISFSARLSSIAANFGHDELIWEIDRSRNQQRCNQFKRQWVASQFDWSFSNQDSWSRWCSISLRVRRQWTFVMISFRRSLVHKKIRMIASAWFDIVRCAE